MHNCKAISKDLVDLALSQTTAEEQPQLAEIRNCPSCGEEFTALQNALRATEIAAQAAQPAESFWPGYHERLCRRLEQSQHFHAAALRERANVPARWREFMTASLRLPVPAALGLLVFFASLIFLGFHAGRFSAVTILAPPAVVTENIPIPIVQEKVITRVVYKTNSRTTPRAVMTARRDAATTAERREEVPAVAQGLEGFKPADEPKLTIIKGSNKDEK